MTSATAAEPAPARTAAAELSHVPVSAVFLALLRRDIRVARKELIFFLVRTTMQPLLFLVVFGYLLPKMNFVGNGYQAALLPGKVLGARPVPVPRISPLMSSSTCWARGVWVSFIGRGSGD